jgi:transposase
VGHPRPGRLLLIPGGGRQVPVPHATQVADPFHVVRAANERLDEVRRRVQNETLGHRGRKSDPLYHTRRLPAGHG